MRKQRTPSHLLIENSQSHISRLVKSLHAINKSSDFKEFDQCMDHLDHVLNLLILHGKRIQSNAE